MKFAIVSILLYVFAENHLSVSARSLRKLSKGSKVKNYNYKTNPVSVSARSPRKLSKGSKAKNYNYEINLDSTQHINRAADDNTSSDDADDVEYPKLMFGENPDELLADCRGDCDSDDECETGLICVQRSAYEAMPGCAGEPSWNTDYCLNPARNFKELAYWGQDGPYGRCAGDCDNDSDCVGNLICFQRDGEENNVPGCPGRAKYNVDYCIAPPTPAPTPPVFNNRADDCIQCQDKQTPYMQNKGISCKEWAMTQYRCTEQSSYYSYWKQERFCELSCAEKGSPYPGPSCCGV